MGYWGTVHRRARCEAVEMVGIDTVPRAIRTALVAVSPVAAWFLVGSATTVADPLGKVLATAGLLAFGGLLFYGWKVLLDLPPRMMAEATAERAELEDKLATYSPQDADEPIEHALCYIMTGVWGPAFPSDITEVFRIFERIRKLAFGQQIVVWGQVSDRTLHRPIPPEFWVDFGMDMETFFSADRPPRTEKARDANGVAFRYYRPMVVRSQIEREFPRP